VAGERRDGDADLFPDTNAIAREDLEPYMLPNRMASSSRDHPSVTIQGNSVIAAIDVGTNAVRLEIARVLPDGSLETLHQERDPIRPGEGVFLSGRMTQEVEDRLLWTMRRYSALCRRYRPACPP
jgi:hypothetical protein